MEYLQNYAELLINKIILFQKKMLIQKQLNINV